MPTLFIIFGFRFFFWSNEHEPIHVHVSRGDSEVKYNVENLELIENFGFKKNELKIIESILEENKGLKPKLRCIDFQKSVKLAS